MSTTSRLNQKFAIRFLIDATHKNTNYAMSWRWSKHIMIIIRLVLEFLAKMKTNLWFWGRFYAANHCGTGRISFPSSHLPRFCNLTLCSNTLKCIIIKSVFILNWVILAQNILRPKKCLSNMSVFLRPDQLNLVAFFKRTDYH